jgi:2',3'-cyclic-nucleotide 2'-phosphodiesterase (5'-nucleotidase family)
VLGNRDFEFGVKALENHIQNSSTTWILSNVLDLKTQNQLLDCERDVRLLSPSPSTLSHLCHPPPLPPSLLFFPPYLSQLLVQWNGVMVGILGFVDNWITDLFRDDEIEFLDIFSTAKSLSADLKARGAEVLSSPPLQPLRLTASL